MICAGFKKNGVMCSNKTQSCQTYCGVHGGLSARASRSIKKKVTVNDLIDSFASVKVTIDCSICCESDIVDSIEMDCCKQTSCIKCIQKWMSKKSTCPFCRASF